MGSYARGHIASGEYHISATSSGAHAEGYASNGNIEASGQGSHAEGYTGGESIIASGAGSHAEGVGT